MNMEAITRRFGHSLYVGSMHPARCTWRGTKHQGVSMGKLRYRGPDTLHSCAFVTARCGMSQALRVVRHGALVHVLHRDQGLLGVHTWTARCGACRTLLMRHRQSSAVASSLPCPQGKRARRLQLDPAEGALADRLEAPRDKSGLSAYYAKLSTAAVTKAGARWFVLGLSC